MHRVIKIMKIKSSIKKLQSCLCTIWGKGSVRIACDHILHVHKGELKLHSQSQFSHLLRTENFTDMNFPMQFFSLFSFYWEVWPEPLRLERGSYMLFIVTEDYQPEPFTWSASCSYENKLANCKLKPKWVRRGKWHVRF